MERIWVKISRMSRYAYLRIVRIKAPAESIALGLAVGVFSGAMPFLSLQMFIAVSLALLLRGNIVAAALGTWWTNPFNWAIVFPLLYILGKIFVPGDIVQLSIAELADLPLLELLHQGWKWLLITTLGGCIAGIPLAVGSYFVALRAVRLYHDKRARRKLERQRGKLHRD
ncbi:MAG: DUF2062 domain-containing protein [Desulfovibrionales bacterium]|nr:DUF2062 domain-containing protein [Desulfovibrionales bacterium]